MQAAPGDAVLERAAGDTVADEQLAAEPGGKEKESRVWRCRQEWSGEGEIS